MDKKILTNVLTWWANMAAQTVAYKNWSGGFCKREMNEDYEKLVNDFNKNHWFDWNDLTEEDCQALGFGKWTSKKGADEENEYYIEQLKKSDLSDEKRKEYEKEIERNKRCVGLRLIPLWLFGMIPEGLVVTNIGGEDFKFRKGKTDLDHRFGRLAYGIYPKDAKRYEDYEKEE
jgi:hypothetical protein